MNTSELLWRSEWFVCAAANLVVVGLCVSSHQRRPRRGVKFLGIAAGLSFLNIIAQWIAYPPPRGLQDLLSVVDIVSASLGVAGTYLLLAELNRSGGSHARPVEVPGDGDVPPAEKETPPSDTEARSGPPDA